MEKMVKVSNRDSGMIGYEIPESGIKREFAVGETKNIPIEELRQLQYVPGGDFILKELLIVHDQDVLNEILNIQTEPEYFYTEAEIKELLNKGTLDQLADALDFAPDGVIELIKQIAVETEVPDVNKRKLISEKTGFNIDNAINVNHIMDAEDAKPAERVDSKQRRTSPIETKETTPQRRTEVPKYNVVKK